MKQSFLILLFLILMIQISVLHSSNNFKPKRISKSNKGTSELSTQLHNLNLQFYNGSFSEDTARFFGSFSKAARCNDKPSKAYFRGFRFYSAQSVMRSNLYPYKTFIHVNQNENKVAISIGGPRNLSNSFYNKLYSEEFKWIPNHRILLEKEFSDVYYTHIRHFLIKKIIQLKFSGFSQAEYIFNGHSIGGSLAIYAAFDLAKSGVISWLTNKPTVYAFGALRIGDVSFAAQVNKYVNVWRITKQSDYLIRAPVCFYSIEEKRWNCKTDYFNQIKALSGDEDDASKNNQSDDDTKKTDPSDYSNTNTSDLNRNVFERNKTPYLSYGKFYTSAFSQESKFYPEIVNKKEELLECFFNVMPSNDSISKLYKANTLILTADDNITFKAYSRKGKSSSNSSQIYSIVKPESPITQDSELTDLNQYHNNFLYFSPPIGRQVFYTSDGQILQCKRTYFGASTCEIQYQLPEFFYSISSHNNYLGIDLEIVNK